MVKRIGGSEKLVKRIDWRELHRRERKTGQTHRGAENAKRTGGSRIGGNEKLVKRHRRGAVRKRQ